MPVKKRVLFLCTGNSARSQIAEGLLRSMAGDRYEPFSAGTHPRDLHPRTIETMKELGIDISGQRSKDVGEFSGQHFDFVITVCDRAKQSCPIFPGTTPIHWTLDDPADAPAIEHPRVFRRVRDEIRDRLRLFLLEDSV